MRHCIIPNDTPNLVLTTAECIDPDCPRFHLNVFTDAELDGLIETACRAWADFGRPPGPES